MLKYAILFICATTVMARSRIVNGWDANISDYPHQVSLQFISSGCTTAGAGYCHICGASILDDTWVLTAAHCVEGRSPSSLVIGAEFTIGRIRDEEYKRIPVSRIFMHESYNSGAGAFPNDVALLKLNGSINLSGSNQASIELAPTGANFNGQTCVISGWGLTSGNGDIPDRLQATDGVIDPNCGLWTNNNHNSNVHICIANPSSGSCNGDSGGPMVCNGVLAGVTSWGASGCRTDYPSVYARVSYYNSWITNKMLTN